MRINLRNKFKYIVTVFAVVISIFLILTGFNEEAAASYVTYYAVLDGVSPEGEPVTINGNKAYILNESGGLYTSARYFVEKPGLNTSYSVYSFDGDEYDRVAFGEVGELDAGWYNFVYDKNRISGSNAYAKLQERDFGDWYLVDSFNSFMYGTYGDVWLDKHSKMTLVTSSDAEYTRAYTQYKCDFTVSEEELEHFGDIYIAVGNGSEFYRNGDEYFIISAPGSYRVLFSERRLYEGNVHVKIIDKDNTSSSEENAEYYLCLSTQNYAIVGGNKLTYINNGEYLIEGVTLSDSVKFCIADKNGSRWYSASGDEMKTEESGSAAYDIKFSPDKVYSEGGEWKASDCHITYKFHSPAHYELDVSGEKQPLTYNAYNFSYDLYYNSRIYLYGGDVITVEGFADSYTAETSGYYRVLFTDGKTSGGDYYCFDEDGNYGTGDGFSYNLYIEKSPSYYAVFLEKINAEADAEINGSKAYLLNRDESNLNAEVYESAEFFVSDRDYDLKYYVYEYTSRGTYNLLDADGDEDTVINKLDIDDAGWYSLTFTVREGNYSSSYEWQKRQFHGFYALGKFNSYGFDDDGGVYVDEKYKFEEVAEDDDDYNGDYNQYILYITLGEQDLKRGDFEFFISDGCSKYKNGNDYIALSEEGTYKILFSEEHIYGRGRHYRYILTPSGDECEEVEISTREEFNEFAKNCNSSADYSVNKSFYLTSDIDFSGAEFTGVNLFCGSFYGGYHTLSGITVTSDNAENVGVFGVVAKNAVIERLNVKNYSVSADGGKYVGFIGKNFGRVYAVNVGGSAEADSYTGGIAGYNGKSLVEADDSSIDSAESYVYGVIENCVSYVSVNGKVHTGGIAGFSSGKIISCKNSGRVNGKKYSSSENIVNVGGIVGYSTGKVTACSNSGNVGYDNIGVYVGGVVGFSSGEVYFAENTGKISASAYSGGIVGYAGVIKREDSSSSLNAYFGGMDYEEFLSWYFGDSGDDFTAEVDNGVYDVIYSVNGGDVSAETYVGGIVGYVSADNLTVNGCISYGNVTASAGSYAGGICAYQNSGNILNCASSGTVKADGFSAGKYVGGIVGYGSDVKYSFSSAVLIGEDYVGGITGYASGTLKGCYSNVSVLSDGAYKGGIAGFASSYDETINSFASVSDNFYIGDFGGIAGINYGSNYDFAAFGLTSEQLLSDGMLSKYLSFGFSSDYWQGGDGENSYPVLSCFEEVIECEAYGDDEEFARYFSLYKSEMEELCKKYASVTHTVIFLEWNEDNGDLYDDDGKLLTENFEVIAQYRLYSGEKVEATPVFVYAESKDGGYVYSGNKAYYSVMWSSFAPDLQENFKVYASYTHIVNSINDEDKLFAEGAFEEGTKVKLIKNGDYYSAEFSFDGEKINPGEVTLKVLVGEDADKYTLFAVDGEDIKEANFVVSGQYISFSYDGGFFTLERETAQFPFWGWIIIGAACGAAAAAAIVVIATKTGKKESAEKRQKRK